MRFRPDHELHRRRASRNYGLGAVLLAFAAMIFGLSLVKARENGVPGLEAARQKAAAAAEAGTTGEGRP